MLILKMSQKHTLENRLNMHHVSEVKTIFDYIDAKNYLQILYSFSIDTLKIIQFSFIEFELYEECHLIKNCVYNYNKSTGENLKI